MKSRIFVAVVGVPILLYLILWAPVKILALALYLLAGMAAWELLRCVGVKGMAVPVITTVSVLMMVLGALWLENYAYQELAVLSVLILFAIAVWKAGEVKTVHLFAAFFAIFGITYAFSSFLRLDAAGYHRGFLLLPLIFSFMSDTGAFFAGKTLGKHKLAPKVSPNKTVEGSIGGFVGNVIGGLVFAFVMNTWFGHAIGYFGIALLGLVCSAVAQLGDLSFSLIKREFGIKDYGKIFLAHGGVLDRFDSVLFVAPVLAILLPLIHMA